MLVGPHPAPLSASEWRSEDDLPRPFFPGVVSRGGARRVATERKVEQLAREQERSRLVELARHQRRIRTGQEAAVLTILQNQISHARRGFRQETRAVQRERRELERDRREMANA